MVKQSVVWSVLLPLLLALATTTRASSFLLDFDDLGTSHGTVVYYQAEDAEDVPWGPPRVSGDAYNDAGHGFVAISVDNPNRDKHDIGALFDTDLSVQEVDAFYGSSVPADFDWDLLSPWDGGNAADDRFGLALIIQENRDGILSIDEAPSGLGDSLLTDPDDEGNRPAGSISFDFGAAPLRNFGFSLLDVEGILEEAGSVDFTGLDHGTGDSIVITIGFSEFTDSTSPFYQAGVVFGNNTANHIDPLSIAALGLVQIDAVTINMGGSGGIDNVNFAGLAVIPLPAAFWLFCSALIGMAVIRRRKIAARPVSV